MFFFFFFQKSSFEFPLWAVFCTLPMTCWLLTQPEVPKLPSGSFSALILPPWPADLCSELDTQDSTWRISKRLVGLLSHNVWDKEKEEIGTEVTISQEWIIRSGIWWQAFRFFSDTSGRFKRRWQRFKVQLQKGISGPRKIPSSLCRLV